MDVYGTMKGLSGEETSALKENMKELGSSLVEISKQSKGRIQFTGLGDLNKNIQPKTVGLIYPVSTLLNTKPIIDGVISEFSDLENIKLNERAGISRGMTEEKQKTITDALYEKSLLAKKLYSTENRKIGDTFSLVDMISPEKFDKRKANDIAIIEREIAAQDAILKNSGQVFAPIDPKSDTSSFSSKKLSVVEQIKLDKELKRVGMPGGSVSAFYDNKSSTNISAPTNNNMGLSANPTNDSVITSRNAQLLGALI